MAQIKLPLTGPNVILRKLRKKDVEKLYTLESDADVKKYVGGPITKSREEWIAGMRQLIESRCATLPLSVIHKGTGDFVGRASISQKDSDALYWELQILITRKYWGKHLGREVCKLLMTAAYDDLGAQSIIAVVDPNNTASRALVEAFEFKKVGTKHSVGWDNGYNVYEHQPARSSE